MIVVLKLAVFAAAVFGIWRLAHHITDGARAELDAGATPLARAAIRLLAAVTRT